jgi:hypothetical protein
MVLWIFVAIRVSIVPFWVSLKILPYNVRNVVEVVEGCQAELQLPVACHAELCEMRCDVDSAYDQQNHGS